MKLEFIYVCLLGLILARIVRSNNHYQIMPLKSNFFDALNTIENNQKLTSKEKNDLYHSLFKEMHNKKQMIFKLQIEDEKKLRKQKEHEIYIYKKYLASRVHSSSILRDFITLRF